MKQSAIIATIPNFNRKGCYSALGLSKSIKSTRDTLLEIYSTPVVNKCVVSTVKRKKREPNPELIKAKKEANRNHKFKLLVSTKLV